MPWLVFAVAVVLGMFVYAAFRRDNRHIWYTTDHDRSAHYEFALNLALGVRHGDVLGVLHHLDGARVWGPLHGILLAVVEMVAGPDLRLAVLPSLCAWIASVVLAFLLARRLLPAYGTAAGVAAALCVLQSPGHRAFAVDVMLESLGGALTLLCLLRYLIAVQEDDLRNFRWLGLSLTLLFLTKTNYWLMIVLGLLLGEGVRHPAFAWACIQVGRRFVFRRDWIVGQLRSPWTWMTFAALGTSLATVVTGGTTLTLGSLRINATSGINAVHLAYAIVFVRVALWWRRNGIGAALAARYPAWRFLADWHAIPVAVYFMLPKRLGYFLWYVSPANSTHGRPGGVLEGARYYLQAFADDYHAAHWLTPLALIGVLLAVAFVRRWRTGAPAILLYLFLIALATCKHPMLKNRHAFPWVAILWVVAASAASACAVSWRRPCAPASLSPSPRACLRTATPRNAASASICRASSTSPTRICPPSRTRAGRRSFRTSTRRFCCRGRIRKNTESRTPPSRSRTSTRPIPIRRS
jgi:hypothetical protein